MKFCKRTLWHLVLISAIFPYQRAIAQNVISPAYLYRPAPIYPTSELAKLHEGRVLVRVFVNTYGLAQDPSVIASSGFPALDTAAVESVSTWRFTPAMRNNVPIGVWISIPITFSLSDSPPPSFKRESWTYVAGNQNLSFYIQKENINGSILEPGVHTMWVLRNYNQPKLIGHIKPFFSTIEEWKLNCVQGTTQTLTSTAFSELYGSSSIVIHDAKVQPERKIISDTFGDAFRQLICQDGLGN